MRRMEIIDLAGEEPVAPCDQKADSATDFQKKEHFQYSAHA
jgi:hypothetical protein